MPMFRPTASTEQPPGRYIAMLAEKNIGRSCQAFPSPKDERETTSNRHPGRQETDFQPMISAHDYGTRDDLTVVCAATRDLLSCCKYCLTQL